MLVLEAGPSHVGIENIMVPYMVLSGEARLDWNYTTIPQAGLNGRSVPFPRGHVLGGSTSISMSPLQKVMETLNPEKMQ